MSGILVRHATAAELDAVSALLADAYREHERADEGWREYVREVTDVRGRWPLGRLLVAELDGRLVGTATFYPPGVSPWRWPPAWASVRLVGVRPDARGRGVGRALTQECIDLGRAVGAPVLGLHTMERMAVARAMYERIGFVRAPEFDFVADSTVVLGYRFTL